MMIPLKDDNPTYTAPVFVVTIIVINLGVYVYALLLGHVGYNMFTARFGAIPFEVMHATDAISPTPIPLYFTLLTSMFMHGGWMHLGGNMLYLWIFGNNIEDTLGHIRFVGFYLLCGIIATAAHVISQPDAVVPMVGASGAIAGVLGAYLAVFPHARILVLFFYFFLRIPALIVLGGWFVIQLVNASDDVGGVAWYAHIAGFVTGYVLMRFRQRKASVEVYERW
jgi:membrane associated rhomboid family serine protease